MAPDRGITLMSRVLMEWCDWSADSRIVPFGYRLSRCVHRFSTIVSGDMMKMSSFSSLSVVKYCHLNVCQIPVLSSLVQKTKSQFGFGCQKIKSPIILNYIQWVFLSSCGLIVVWIPSSRRLTYDESQCSVYIYFCTTIYKLTVIY